jgi:hypothetical protein
LLGPKRVREGERRRQERMEAVVDEIREIKEGEERRLGETREEGYDEIRGARRKRRGERTNYLFHTSSNKINQALFHKVQLPSV